LIIGAHVLIYSKDAGADRAFLRDVLGLSHVDAGDGWLIFALPPAEVGVHPAKENGAHALSFMTDNVETEIAALKAQGVACTPVENQGYGLVSMMTLPGGGQVQLYQPLHPLAITA
jgi:catechol 2,3-dioxygenase-like lactoylglutathione lyase family enzyme